MSWCLMGIGLWCAAAISVSAAPLDLNDATPRWIEVRFEVSPKEAPGALDRKWGLPRTAFIEPIDDPGSRGTDRVRSAQSVQPVAAALISHPGPEPLRQPARLLRIRIPAAEVEAQLRSEGSDPIPGSFSEFVWTLDPESGHVLNATVSGKVREHFKIGPIRSSAQVAIDVEMDTARKAGFESGHGVLGIPSNRYCAPHSGRSQCVPVAAVPFDSRRGYVNAVGRVRAVTGIARIQAFSPLGEVVFREFPRPPTQVGTHEVVSGTSQADALCSDTMGRACSRPLGGES